MSAAAPSSRRDGATFNFLPARRSASAVFATATCPSATAGIVSKRIKISSNFYLRLVATPHRISNTTHDCEILTGRGACHSGEFKIFSA